MINDLQIAVVNDILDNEIINFQTFIKRRVRNTFTKLKENERLTFENDKYEKVFIIEHPQHGLSFIKDFDKLIDLLLENNFISLEKSSKDIHDHYLVCRRSDNNLIIIEDMKKIRAKYFDKEIVADHMLNQFVNYGYNTKEQYEYQKKLAEQKSIEQSDRKNKKISSVTQIIYVTIILIQTCFLIYFQHKSSKLEDELNELKTKQLQNTITNNDSSKTTQ